MSASDYLEGAVLNHIFEGSAFTQPTVWVGLSLADPLDDGSGLAEPSGGGYARVRPADDSGRWLVSESGGVTTAENKGVINFPEATGDWGTISYACLFDADTGGNLLAHTELTIPRSIMSGDSAKFEIGEFMITLD